MNSEQLTYATIGYTTLAVYLLYRCTRTFYDVYLGPLSKIPGPKLAAATRLVLAYHKISGNGERWLHELHRKYGGIVRPAPGEISFANGHNWKAIYGYAHGSNKAAMVKDLLFYYRDPSDLHIGSVADKDHSRHRKAFSHAFSDQALSQQEPLVQQYVDQLISQMRLSKAEEKVDMVKNYNFTTFDIMADLMFGEPLGCLQNSEYTSWVKTIFASLTIITFMVEINYRPLLRKLLYALLPPSLKRKQAEHFQHSVDRVNRRLVRNTTRPDIMGFVEKANLKDDEKLKLSELYTNAQLFMFAGTETTATLLSGMTYYLLIHPEKLKHLTDEIRANFDSNQDINAVTVSKLFYLSCCIQETLRIYPPVPMGLPRLVSKPGIELDGYFLPEGTTVYNHLYSTFRHPDNFAQPEAFMPERWNKSNMPRDFEGDNHSACQPFSIGPRNCLGINLAYMEIRLIMAHVLYNFDMTLCDESHDWIQQRTFCLWEKGPLMVTMRNAR